SPPGAARRAAITGPPARRMPVPPVLEAAQPVGGPHDDVRDAAGQLLLAARADVASPFVVAAHRPHDPLTTCIALGAHAALEHPRQVAAVGRTLATTAPAPGAAPRPPTVVGMIAPRHRSQPRNGRPVTACSISSGDGDSAGSP